MEKLVSSQFKLGIIAGGQLGKMLALTASNWAVKTYVLDPDSDCPAADVCSCFVKGDFANFQDVYEFGKQVDMLTFEIENVNIAPLLKLEKEGLKIFPEPHVVALIQDKGLQKQFFAQHNIPTARFELFDSRVQIEDAISAGHLQYPFVQKLRKSGYDGRGVVVIDGSNDLQKLLDGPSIVEDKVRVEQEVALQVARNKNGCATFPLVDMEFNPQANLVEFLSCPSATDLTIQEEAKRLAEHIISNLGMTGLLAVEFFLDSSGRLLVNEISPRAHNSGHHTIESCITSQYEQHLRSILGFELGSTELIQPSVMINLLGATGHEGAPIYKGLSESLSIQGTKIHIYGKAKTKPYRKMGHATVLDKSLEHAKLKARQVKNLITITA